LLFTKSKINKKLLSAKSKINKKLLSTKSKINKKIAFCKKRFQNFFPLIQFVCYSRKLYLLLQPEMFKNYKIK